jgi:hypothetical protein
MNLVSESARVLQGDLSWNQIGSIVSRVVHLIASLGQYGNLPGKFGRKTA